MALLNVDCDGLASVQLAQFLFKLGLQFIGVVKTATKGSPKNTLQAAQFNNRGDHIAYYHEGDGTMDDLCLLAMSWVDRKQRSFISSTSNLHQALPIVQCHLCQVNKTPNAPLELVNLEIPQTNMWALYYNHCSMIERHNQMRQDDLGIERKFVTKSWHMRVSMLLFSTCVVDACLLHKACTGTENLPNAFFWKLATELINQMSTRSGQVPGSCCCRNEVST